MILKSPNISIAHNHYNYYNHNPLYTSISSLVFGNIPQEIWDYLINKTIYVNDITLDDYSSFTIVLQGKHIVSSFICTVNYKQIIPAVVSRNSKEEKYLKTTTNTFLFSYILSEIFNNDKNIELQEYISTQYPYLFI